MTSKTLIIVLIIMLCAPLAYSYRITKPLRITDFDQRGLVIVNDNFERLFDITNGRYGLNITNVNPDGNVKGEVGDMILLNNAGTYYLEINVGGTIWRGVLLQNLP